MYSGDWISAFEDYVYIIMPYLRMQINSHFSAKHGGVPGIRHQYSTLGTP